jgi:hypothetical protein
VALLLCLRFRLDSVRSVLAVYHEFMVQCQQLFNKD